MSSICARVLERFTDLTREQLEAITADAFGTFNGGKQPPLPLEKVGDVYLLDTGLGPTLAFKDIGQQVVARLLSVYLGRRGGHANIIVETSGDTGPAAISGVAGLAGCDIFVLFPDGRVSDVQELQMVTLGSDAANVHVYRTEGDTDEQAEALKLLFSDQPFMKQHSVVSINSINWARVMVQASYYVWAYLQLRPNVDGAVHFVVPSGALGDATGGLVARLMGVPIGRICCATNVNDVCHRTISQGDLSIAPNVPTVSPAMDIQFAYNVERILYFVSGRDSERTARIMRAAQQRRAERLPADLLTAVQRVFVSAAVSDDETCATMARVHANSGVTLDPHSAIGVRAARVPHIRAALANAAPDAPIVCVLTAHPAKFESACERAGIPVATHPHVEALRKRKKSFTWLRAPAAPSADKLSVWAATIKRDVEGCAAQRARAAPPARSKL